MLRLPTLLWPVTLMPVPLWGKFALLIHCPWPQIDSLHAIYAHSLASTYINEMSIYLLFNMLSIPHFPTTPLHCSTPTPFYLNVHQFTTVKFFQG